jgi:mono/diheme cytochrome c family protein
MRALPIFVTTCLISGVVIFCMVTAFTIQGNKPWPVPDKNAAMANPVKSDAGSIAEGKELYVKHCQSCHGKAGHGDGTKAAQLKTEPGTFAAPAFQKQRDGAIFYKISEGREDMPSFKKKIPDATDIWNLVNYTRTLKN